MRFKSSADSKALFSKLGEVKLAPNKCSLVTPGLRSLLGSNVTFGVATAQKPRCYSYLCKTIVRNWDDCTQKAVADSVTLIQGQWCHHLFRSALPLPRQRRPNGTL